MSAATPTKPPTDPRVVAALAKATPKLPPQPAPLTAEERACEFLRAEVKQRYATEIAKAEKLLATAVKHEAKDAIEENTFQIAIFRHIVKVVSDGLALNEPEEEGGEGGLR